MVSYDVVCKDGGLERIEGADAYQQEGTMTTFFATEAGRQVVDCWSTRIASIRTSEILSVRRVARPADSTAAAEDGADGPECELPLAS